MKKYYKYALFIILVGCVIVLAFCNMNARIKIKSIKSSYSALNSEMVKYKNKYGQEVAKSMY